MSATPLTTDGHLLLSPSSATIVPLRCYRRIEMADTVHLTRIASSETTVDRARQRSNSPRLGNVLIGPDQVLEYLPNPKADEVLRHL